MAKKPKLDTPRNGRNWCDVVNEPIPERMKPKFPWEGGVVIGTMTEKEYRNRKLV